MSNNNNQSKEPPSGETRWGRDRLPHKQAVNGYSLWNILKKCFGRELYKITMPVEFNEPLSFLQRVTETFEYAELLETAAAKEDPVERMKARKQHLLLTAVDKNRTVLDVAHYNSVSTLRHFGVVQIEEVLGTKKQK